MLYHSPPKFLPVLSRRYLACCQTQRQSLSVLLYLLFSHHLLSLVYWNLVFLVLSATPQVWLVDWKRGSLFIHVLISTWSLSWPSIEFVGTLEIAILVAMLFRRAYLIATVREIVMKNIVVLKRSHIQG